MTPDFTDPRALATLKIRLRRGQSRERIGAAYGLSSSAVCRLLARLDLVRIPDGEVGMPEVQQALGLSSLSAAHNYVRDQGLILRHWGKLRTILQTDLDRLLAQREKLQVYAIPPEGCYTAAQIAERHGLNPGSFRTLIGRGKVRPVGYLRGKHRLTALYDLARVAALLPTPAHPRQAPPGHLTVAEVATLTGSSRTTVRVWGRRGAPFVVCSGVGHAHAFHPLHLADWLERTMQLEYARRKARSLRRHVAGQQGRAA